MVDAKSRRCRIESCGKQTSFGGTGTKRAEYCAQHAPGGIVDVKIRMCRSKSCGKIPSFGVARTKTAEYCSQHAHSGMGYVRSRKCRTERCGKQLSFGVANSRTVEYCSQHARLQCGVEAFREREVGPHHSGKETIGNFIPSGAEHTTVHPPPTQTYLPLGVNRDSRKRVLHPEITSAASKRAVARESTAGAVTVPDIDRQKAPTERNSSMKTEVQLSL